MFLNGSRMVDFRNAEGLVRTGNLGRLQKCSKCCISVLMYLRFISIQLADVMLRNLKWLTASEASAGGRVFSGVPEDHCSGS